MWLLIKNKKRYTKETYHIKNNTAAAVGASALVHDEHAASIAFAL